MALMVAVALVLIPFEAGYVLYRSKKTGLPLLTGVLRYGASPSLKQDLLLVPAVFLVVGLIFTLVKPVDMFLREQLFAWLPALDSGLQEGHTCGTLIITYLMVAIFGVVVGPTVEEFYFRGYLLPRMPFRGKRALLLHGFLFAVYHIWTPWMLLSRTLGTLPLAYAAQRRSIYLAIAVHVLVNAIDLIAGISFILGMP
jgi:membrane protease YdiL (CAAX protease family)